MLHAGDPVGEVVRGGRGRQADDVLLQKRVVVPPDRVVLGQRAVQLRESQSCELGEEEIEQLTAEASSTFFFRSSLLCSAVLASSAAASARNSIASQAGSSALDEMAGSESGSEEGVLRARGVTKAVQVERGCLSRPRTL